MEISPAYVDVAIGRWEGLTGLEAVHDKTGLTFAEMRVKRVEGQEPLGDESAEPSTTSMTVTEEDF